MGTASIIDIESLVQPISSDEPTGVALTSMSTEFDALKSAFSAAKVAERKVREELIAAGSEGLANVAAPEWSDVTDQAATLLRAEGAPVRASGRIDMTQALWLPRRDGRVGQDGVPGAGVGAR